jgi:hypothetical protein
MAKICKMVYIQYMNDSNNNFSLIRNGEINRIGPNFLNPGYYFMFDINEKMKVLHAHEDEKYMHEHSQIWKRDPQTYTHKYCNYLVNKDYDCQYCIIGVDSLIYNMEMINELYKNPRNDFILLDNKCNINYLWMKLDQFNLDKIKCYSLIDVEESILVNYFNVMYRSIDNYQIINAYIKKPKFNTHFSNRYQVINSNTSKSDKYLEIGVEYGETIQNTHFLDKTGVDPDPKSNLHYIIKKTSDDFFQSLKDKDEHQDKDDISSIDSDDNIIEISINSSNITKEKINFDVVFIDGMHQVEYLIKDFNNSVKYLNKGGKIFIDDILPSNHSEQRKIPLKHYYENGILKYGEPWTGDVWKLLYHMLLKYKDNIETFKYYNNINYRGIAFVTVNKSFEIDEKEVDAINGYEYFKDFNDYIDLLGTYSN